MFADNTQQCFAFTPQANFSAHNLNFHWRWWNQIQATFLKSSLLYFKIFFVQLCCPSAIRRTSKNCDFDLKNGQVWAQITLGNHRVRSFDDMQWQKKMKPRNINHYGGYHKNWPLFLFESWMFERYSLILRLIRYLLKEFQWNCEPSLKISWFLSVHYGDLTTYLHSQNNERNANF